MEEKPNEYLGWAFWLMWVLANTVAWIVGMSVLWVLSFILGPLTQGPLQLVGWAIVGSFVGGFFGVNHWFLFRPLGANTIGHWAHWWVLATIAGWSAAIMVIIGLGTGENLGFTVTGAVIGISVGIPQWFVLRPYAQRAEWWGLSNMVGWILGLAMIDVLGQGLGFPLVGMVSGTLTGGMMVWLLRNPRPAIP
ncbi:MAG TPA: hypothetical protein VI451_11470 [Anaerolineales bacterium]|nr:hypothetical protein [Anaerolineales bacterium]